MSKAFIFGFVAGAVLLIVGASASSRFQQKTAKQQEKDAEQKRYMTEIVDATPVQLGVLTNQQRIHSKPYSAYLQITRGKTMSDLAAKAEGKHKVVGMHIGPGLMHEETDPETPENYFGKLANEMDAIIRGRVTKKTSQIAEGDSFIFTDYDVLIEEVLKNNIAAPIEAGAMITVNRPGGKVVLNGVIVKATDAAFEPLPLTNEVILFLKFIPEAGTYQTQAIGSFELDSSSVRPLTGDHFPPGVLQNKDSFLQTLRAVSINNK